MNKFLKKYQKWIMVGGGSLIMVAWLLPQGLSGMSDPKSRTVATLNGRKVKGAEWDLSNRQYKAITTFIQRVSSRSQRPPLTALEQLGCSTAEHFFLLATQAQRQGLIGGKADSDEVMDQSQNAVAMMIAMEDMQSGGPESTRALDFAMSMQSQPGIKPEELASREAARQYYFEVARSKGIPRIRQEAMGTGGLNEEQFDAAVATYRGIIRMYDNYVGMAKMSDRRVVATARRFGESSSVDYVLVGADRLASRVPEPTPEEISAHYQTYKAIAPGTGEFGIGYRKPDRVKIEWVEINKAKVAASIRLIDTHVRERWNMDNPGGTTADFATKRTGYETSLRNEYAEEIIKLADTRYREAASDTARVFPADGKFRTLPANWRETRLAMDTLATELAAAIKSETTARDSAERWQSPVEIEKPLVNPETPWSDATDLRKLPGIGAATTADGNRKVPFGDLVLSVRELTSKPLLPIQVGLIPVLDRVTADNNGNHYYYRVTAARPAGEPESLDEVRTQVVADIKRLRAFVLLKDEIDRAGAASLTGGLDAAVSTFTLADTANVAVTPAAPLSIRKGLIVRKEQVQSASPTGNDDAQALNVPAFRDAIAEKTSTLDARAEIASLPSPDRSVWLTLPASLSGVVAHIQAVSPVTVERVRTLDADILSTATQDELGPFNDWIKKSPFNLDSLKKALDFKQAGTQGDRGA